MQRLLFDRTHKVVSKVNRLLRNGWSVVPGTITLDQNSQMTCVVEYPTARFSSEDRYLLIQLGIDSKE